MEESTADNDEDKTTEKDRNQKSRDKRVEEYLNPEKRRVPDVDTVVPSGPAPSAFTLGDDEYWNEFLNGARKSVLDKLVQSILYLVYLPYEETQVYFVANRLQNVTL